MADADPSSQGQTGVFQQENFDEHDIISALRALGTDAPLPGAKTRKSPISTNSTNSTTTTQGERTTTRGRRVKPPVKLRAEESGGEAAAAASARGKRAVVKGLSAAGKKAKTSKSEPLVGVGDAVDDDDVDDDDAVDDDAAVSAGVSNAAADDLDGAGADIDDDDNDADDDVDNNNNNGADNARILRLPSVSSVMSAAAAGVAASSSSTMMTTTAASNSAAFAATNEFDVDNYDGEDDDGDAFGEDDDGGASRSLPKKRKYTKRTNMTAPKASVGPTSQLRRRLQKERKRDFKPGTERRTHHVQPETLLSPPVLTEAQSAVVIQDMQLRALQRAQVIDALARDPVADISVVMQMSSDVGNDLAKLHSVCCACVLPQPLLANYFRGVVLLKRQENQLEVLATACSTRQNVYRLLILCDLPPPPTIPFKGKPTQVPEYRVQLFVARGGDAPIESLQGAVMQAASKCAAKEFSKASATLTNATAPLAADRTALFSSLVIEESSRMEFVALEFSLIRPAALAQLVEPVESAPMIVVTNESQWPGAAKRLLWHDAFVDEQQIPWPLFANMLNMHMICGLQQPLDTATRPLHDWELRYLHRNPRWFNGEKLVSREQALAFWSFFGAALTALRFKRHCFTMWSRALALGFVSRDKASSLLAGERPGTFCVRFSESLPGAFAIAFVVSDAERETGVMSDAVTLVQVPSRPGEVTVVKHFLILPTQLGHNRTLPDFIRDKSEFKYICALRSTQSDSVTAITDKDATLAPFYKHDRLDGKLFSGYVSSAN